MTYSGRVPRLFLTAVALALALPAAALELALPAGAERLLTRSQDVAGFRIATGVFDNGAVPSREVDGAMTEDIWRLPGDGDGGNPARLAALLRNQLLMQGYEIGFSCADTACGGFDFRFALPIAQGPEMYVDLGAFHYLSARRTGPAGSEDVALTLSRGGQAGYVHVARISTSGTSGTTPAPLVPVSSAPVVTSDRVIDQLTTQGHAVLDDLTFNTGASALSGNRYESLVTLAAWLAQDQSRRVALVGHTDASGAQDANTALSLARAEAVRRALITDHGTRAEQVTAAGVGFLSPRTTNSTPAGREANRRVEVVLLSN
jgi:OOP family OmpA-OmpF porin